MKNKFVTIGLIQSRVSADTENNVERTVKMIRQAAKNDAQIICLQELFQTPYFPQRQGQDKDKYAETIPGSTTETIIRLAKELGIVIIVPLFEKAKDGRYYNTALVVDEKGKMLGKYHKVHIPQDPGFYEKDYFEHGKDGYKVFKTKFGSFAVLICYDQWFPEAARVARLSGAEIIFYPTAIADIVDYVPPEGHWQNAWETVMRGHAIANSVVVAAVNRIGREGNSKFWGQSFVADAFGKVIKRATPDKEEVVIVKVDLSMNKFISEGWGFLRNRRPDTYKMLLTNKFVEKTKKLKNIAHYKNIKKSLGKNISKR